MIESRLGAPAEIQGGKGVRCGPVQLRRQLGPVIDVLEGNLLDRRAGDDQAVVIVVLDIVEGIVILL